MNPVPYKDRCTVLNCVREIAGWHLKIYTIHENKPLLTPGILEAAIDYTSRHVEWPRDRKGYGFLTVHVGDEAVWLLVDLWMDDIMRHFLYRAPVDAPTRFDDGPKDGTLACVWELAVFAHERSSWIKNVMARPDNPDYKAYLSDGLEIFPRMLHD